MDELLDGTFHIDKKGMGKVESFTVMASFLKVLKRPTSSTTGYTIIDMDTDLTIE